MQSRSTIEEVLAVLHRQGSTKISLDVLRARAEVIDDWETDAGDGEVQTFPCVAFANGVRWFYDRDRRPKTKAGSPMKALAAPGHRAFLGDIDASTEVQLFEGERDWLTALSLDMDGAICIGGVDNLDMVQIGALATKVKVTIIFDNDDPGRAAAQSVAAQLTEAGTREIRIAHLPCDEGLDFSDWIESLPDGSESNNARGLVTAASKVDKRSIRKAAREAKREQKSKDSREAHQDERDEFVTPEGDPVTLVFELSDPGRPEDIFQDVKVRFARYDVAGSKKSGLLVVDVLDRYEPKQQEAPSDEGDMYSSGFAAEENEAVVRPLSGQWAEKRVILLPTGAKEHGTSEGLFDDLVSVIDDHFVVEDDFIHAMAAYVMLSYRYRDAQFESIPYIRAVGRPGTGKTRFCRIMAELCYRSAIITNVRAAHVYRMLEAMRGGITLVFEEFDFDDTSKDAADMLGILTAGNQHNSWVPRMTGKNFSEVEFLPCFSPKVISMHREVTNEGMIRRCITGHLGGLDIPKAKRFHDLPASFYQRCDDLRKRLLGWRFAKYGLGRREVAPVEADALSAGVWQNWYPLLAMVPEGRPDSLRRLLRLAQHTNVVLKSAREGSTEAQVVASVVRSRGKGGRSWLSDVLNDLREADPNARWSKSEVARELRSFGVSPKRSRRADGEGNYPNEHYVLVDQDFQDRIARSGFNIEVEETDAQAAAGGDVM